MPTPRSTDSPSPPASRPGAEDREAAIDRLSAAFVEDQLSTEELESRVAAVYRATTQDVPARLTADLPVAARGEGNDPTRPSMAPEISTILGSMERRGPTIVPSQLWIRSILGNIALDLREAEFHEGVTEIAVRAVLGNVEFGGYPRRLRRGRGGRGHG